VPVGSDNTAGMKSNSYPRSDEMYNWEETTEALRPVIALILVAIEASVSGVAPEVVTSTS
jgi:hypothetical protein